MALLPRLIGPLLEAQLTAAPVVVLEGGRAVGKSTLCDQIIDAHEWAPRLDCSEPDVAALLRLDPDRSLTSFPSPCVLDEAQLIPELPLWVKRIVDRRPGSGQFLLTGSARLGRHGLGGSDPLAGRSVRLRMHSLTRAELVGHGTDFLERAFGEGWEIGQVADPDGSEPSQSWRGGLPGISGVRTPSSDAQWEREMAAYVEAVLPLGAAGTRADLGRLLRTFRYVAATSGQLLNYARAASELGVQAATVRNHLDLLEAAFLLTRVEAERPTEHRVVTAHPRLYAADVGLAAWAARAWVAPPSASVIGALAETSVAHDLVAFADAAPERMVVRHWRDERNQREVDVLVVHPDGRMVPVEVKASSTVGPGDTLGLRAFLRRAGSASPRGLVVYGGRRVLDLTDPDDQVPVLAVPRSLL